MKSIMLIPTYNRAELLKKCAKSYVQAQSTIKTLVMIDKADPQKEQYLALVLPERWTIVLTEGRTMAAKCREVAEQFMDQEAIVICNDDHEFVTPRWDVAVLSQINGSNIVGTNDDYQAPQRLAGASCFSGKILRTLGWPIFPPFLEHLYIDNVYEHIGSRAQCIRILMDVMVKHNHALKHGQEDATHKEIYGEDFKGGKTGDRWAKDKEAFERWLREDAEKDALKIVQIQPKTGVMIATPAHDGHCSLGYALGLSDFAVSLNQQNVYFEMARVVGSSLLPHARNSLADMFVKSKCQKLLFVDADQGWDRNAAWALLNSPRRIIAGITPHKRFPINLNFEPLEKDQHFFKDLTNKSMAEFQGFAQARADKLGEIEVNRSGTGFMMIDRSVFDLMSEQVDDYLAFDFNQEAKHKEFFKMGINNKKRYTGEDWHFTELAKKLGIPIYISARAFVSHHGNFIFQAG